LEQKSLVNEKKLELDDSQKLIDQLIQLSRRYDSAKSQADEIDKALPRSSQQAEIMLELQSAAAENGVTIGSIQFTGKVTPDQAQTNQSTALQDLIVVPISIRASATYPQLIAYLNRLETLSRYNSVTSLTANKSQANRDNLEISMSLVAYLKP
jgi:Tfp pilus assembly protein PilO